MKKNTTTTFIHNLVKIKLINEGYLSNFPYHLISDNEMCDAFLSKTVNSDGNVIKSGYFFDAYPCIVPEYRGDNNVYDNLERSIRYHIYCLKKSSDSEYTLPDWIYSYMLGKTVGVFSDKLDIHDLIYPMGVDNIDDEFTADASRRCFEESKKWLKSNNEQYVEFEHIETSLRPPTMFGEPHVIKSIRLNSLSPMSLR